MYSTDRKQPSSCPSRSLLCIVISSFGIYSLVARSAGQRKKEIAIRKVNGDLFKDILHLFLKEYLLLVIPGNLPALPVGNLFVARWLEGDAYHTQIGVGLYLSVFLITCSIVVLSVARRPDGPGPCRCLRSIRMGRSQEPFRHCAQNSTHVLTSLTASELCG
jgi:hypothetical protein